jgi:hypothetical protein
MIIFEEESIKIDLTTSDYKIVLNYANVHPGTNTTKPLNIKTTGNNSLTWFPLQLKGIVNGSISMVENRLEYNNSSG